MDTDNNLHGQHRKIDKSVGQFVGINQYDNLTHKPTTFF